jgi:hypothetical protein
MGIEMSPKRTESCTLPGVFWTVGYLIGFVVAQEFQEPLLRNSSIIIRYSLSRKALHFDEEMPAVLQSSFFLIQ